MTPSKPTAFRAGVTVELPEGGHGVVVGEDAEGLVIVRLDGEAIGHYPAEGLRPVATPKSEKEED